MTVGTEVKSFYGQGKIISSEKVEHGILYYIMYYFNGWESPRYQFEDEFKVLK